MFIAVGVIGALLLLVFLIFDDFFEGILPESDWISGPVIGAFLAAFGLFGWTVTEAFDAPTGLAVVAGFGGGVALGYLAYRVSRVLLHSPTDATPTAADLVGREGRVITGSAPGRLGEVLVTMSGQPRKLSAVSAEELVSGAAVVVVDVESATKVVVEPADRFWSTDRRSTTENENR